MTRHESVGIVVIGRNLGALLQESLQSVRGQCDNVVYVDSGSTDGSVAQAEPYHIPVVALDSSQPFSSARGRNAGARFLLAQNNQLEFIQFVDGDCLLAGGFISAALKILRADSRIAAVCGQRRECFPHISVYQHFTALGWESPVGEIEFCGGDALVRVSAFRQVNGFDERLHTGEDPEMALRLRRAGWKLWCIPDDMTYHDARMTQFDQWWKRSMRTGYAYAEGTWMHGRSPERYRVHESTSIWFWGAGVWLAALGLARPSRGTSMFLLLGYPLLMARIYKRSLARGWSAEDARLYAIFCVLGKFPQLQGQLQFLAERLLQTSEVSANFSQQTSEV